MNLETLYSPFEEFQGRFRDSGTETSVIRLEAGDSEGTGWCSHEGSQQMVLVLEGKILAEMNGGSRLLAKGGTVVIGEDVSYRLTNPGNQLAIGFAVLAPKMVPPCAS